MEDSANKALEVLFANLANILMALTALVGGIGAYYKSSQNGKKLDTTSKKLDYTSKEITDNTKITREAKDSATTAVSVAHKANKEMMDKTESIEKSLNGRMDESLRLAKAEGWAECLKEVAINTEKINSNQNRIDGHEIRIVAIEVDVKATLSIVRELRDLIPPIIKTTDVVQITHTEVGKS